MGLYYRQQLLLNRMEVQFQCLVELDELLALLKIKWVDLVQHALKIILTELCFDGSSLIRVDNHSVELLNLPEPFFSQFPLVTVPCNFHMQLRYVSFWVTHIVDCLPIDHHTLHEQLFVPPLPLWTCFHEQTLPIDEVVSQHFSSFCQFDHFLNGFV